MFINYANKNDQFSIPLEDKGNVEEEEKLSWENNKTRKYLFLLPSLKL